MLFSSFFLCMFCLLISVCKAEQTFARCSVKKQANRCTHTHLFTRCCFCLVALPRHAEYGENIFFKLIKAVKLHCSVLKEMPDKSQNMTHLCRFSVLQTFLQLLQRIIWYLNVLLDKNVNVALICA